MRKSIRSTPSETAVRHTYIIYIISSLPSIYGRPRTQFSATHGHPPPPEPSLPHASHSTQAGHPPSKAASPQKPRTRKAANQQKPRNPPSLKAPKASKPKESQKMPTASKLHQNYCYRNNTSFLAAKPEFLHRFSTKQPIFRHYVEKIVCFGDTT